MVKLHGDVGSLWWMWLPVGVQGSDSCWPSCVCFRPAWVKTSRCTCRPVIPPCCCTRSLASKRRSTSWTFMISTILWTAPSAATPSSCGCDAETTTLRHLSSPAGPAGTDSTAAQRFAQRLLDCSCRARSPPAPPDSSVTVFITDWLLLLSGISSQPTKSQLCSSESEARHLITCSVLSVNVFTDDWFFLSHGSVFPLLLYKARLNKWSNFSFLQSAVCSLSSRGRHIKTCIHRSFISIKDSTQTPTVTFDFILISSINRRAQEVFHT